MSRRGAAGADGGPVRAGGAGRGAAAGNAGGPVRRRGVVTAFDARVGLGVVTVGGTGDARPPDRAETVADWPFHCTQISDGSRTIDAGTAVSFEVVAGRNGRWEAADLRVDSAVRPAASGE